MNLKKAAAWLSIAAFSAAPLMSRERHNSIPRLDHVFVIVMENQYYGQIIGNTQSVPWFNQHFQTVNHATNYFAVGHPSLTNYLEIVGGSNFGIVNDNSPDWRNTNCAEGEGSGKILCCSRNSSTAASKCRCRFSANSSAHTTNVALTAKHPFGAPAKT
jgi:phosphatidylinositol-3-phosphatase